MANYIHSIERDNKVLIKVSKEELNSEGVVSIDISRVSTRALLGLRDAVTGEINGRMDLGSVSQEALDALREKLKTATIEEKAIILRDIIDRGRDAESEVDRVDTLKEVVREDVLHTLKTQKLSKLTVDGAVSMSVTQTKSFSVDPDRWDDIYEYVAQQIEIARKNGLPISTAFAILQKSISTTQVKDFDEQGEKLPDAIKATTKTRLNVRRTK